MTRVITRAASTAALSLGILLGGTAVTSAGGTLPDGNGNTLCKGFGHCIILETECAGMYIDYVDPQGTTYGKCSPKKHKAMPGLVAPVPRTAPDGAFQAPS